MKNKRAMLVVGARPNFMKVAPLISEMKKGEKFLTRLVHTGQHFDKNMSQVFFDEFQMPEPDVHLGINRASHTHQIARAMMALESDVEKWNPDLVVVVGDVNSTLAAGLVASKMGVRLAHVEAGLRSFDRTMPEEINRLLVDQLADYLFTPSRDADENLKAEGIAKERIFLVGNIMVDTLLKFRDRAEKLESWKKFSLNHQQYGVVTLHRPSNVDAPNRLSEIVEALGEIQKELPLLFPVHPRTKSRLEAGGWMEKLKTYSQLVLTEPMGYLENLNLMAHARVVMTDSGGIQEETTILGVPCLTVRTNTERPITILEGTNRLVRLTKQGILEGFHAVSEAKSPPTRQPELWDGNTASRIVDVLQKK
jgi:UDP-N-acetylglucosamine 2-epimerase (non-hydrolysing)